MVENCTTVETMYTVLSAVEIESSGTVRTIVVGSTCVLLIVVRDTLPAVVIKGGNVCVTVDISFSVLTRTVVTVSGDPDTTRSDVKVVTIVIARVNVASSIALSVIVVGTTSTEVLTEGDVIVSVNVDISSLVLTMNVVIVCVVPLMAVSLTMLINVVRTSAVDTAVVMLVTVLSMVDSRILVSVVVNV
jgi:hypothetical protein